MQHRRIAPCLTILATVAAFAPGLALAGDLEGIVERVDPDARVLVVAGREFHVDERTDFDDEYTRLEDVNVGDRVEIDYQERDGRLVATEIERDD